MSDPAGGHPRDLLSGYFDDELPVDERNVVDRHLASCEDCRGQLAALSRLSRAIADESVPPVPVDLLERTGRRLDEATVLRPRRFRFAAPVTIAATLAAIGMLVALQWHDGALVAPPAREEAKQQNAMQDRAASAPGATSAPTAPPPPAAEPARPLLKQPIDSVAAPKQKKDEFARTDPEPAPEGVEGGVPGGVPGGVVGGVAGGVAGGAGEAGAHDVQDPDGDGNANVNGARERDFKTQVGAPAPQAMDGRMAAAAKAVVYSPCVGRWSDSGVRGVWIVTDEAAAAAELDRVARGVGGAMLSLVDGRPYILSVPRERFEEVRVALGAKGVTGLAETPVLPPGDDCAAISLTLSTAPPVPLP